MRLLPNIGFGTKSYPPEIARRLRVLNIASWMAAMLAGGFAVAYFASGSPGLVQARNANTVLTVLFAAIPLLHRFGALAAPLAFGIIAYAAIFIVCSMVGTEFGMTKQYLVVMAAMVAVVGTEHVVILGTFAVVAAILIVATELTVPLHTGIQPLVPSLIAGTSATCAILFAIVYYELRETARAEAKAEREFERSESLLRNILPSPVAERLKTRGERVIADKHEAASVLFADMAEFTARASDTLPEELVEFLNRVFTDLDRLVEQHELEKIKTTGDAYMVVSGVPMARGDHAEVLADLALAMRDSAKAWRDPHDRPVLLRIGMASGPVVAGVTGTRKFFYDVWGDTVNVASRMETTGEAGGIQVAPQSYALLKDRFEFAPRGPIEVKGKGRMNTWMLVGRNRP